MPRSITVTFSDGSQHVYANAPDDVTPDMARQRAERDFGKTVTGLDGGRAPTARPEAYVKAANDAITTATGEGMRILAAGVAGSPDEPTAAPSVSPGAGFGARSRGLVANAPAVRQTAGDFTRTLPRAILPSAASMAGFGAGSTAVGTALLPLEAAPGPGTIVHGAATFAGGLVGAMLASGATRAVQERAIDALPTSITAPLGQDRATRERDAQRSPYAVMAGEMAPGFLFAGPGAGLRVPTVASPAQRIFQSPLAQSAIGATIGGGANIAQQYVTTGKVDPVQAGVATVVGATQTRNTRAGEALTNAGARMANYGAGLFGAQRAQFESMAGDFENRHGPNPTFDPAGDPPPNPPSGGWKSVETPEGEILSADGNAPLNFADHKQAARFAVVNALGGSHDIAIVGNRIVLRRRDGSAPPAPMRDTTGDEVSGQVPTTQTEPVAPPTAPEVAPAAPSQTPGVPPPVEAARAPETLQPGEQEVTAPSGQKVRTRFEIVDASALRKAEGELQNRDRSRDSTDLQVTDIVSKFDPTRLGPSAESDRGAPIIGPDGIIESGNGRTMAIERVFAEHPEKAAAYRAYIESLGYDTTGIERPVLVRRRLTEMTPEERRAWIVGSNKDTKLELSPAERARSDADSITPEMLAKYAGGDLNSTANSGFVEAFNKGLTVGEMNNMIGSDRRLTPVGQQRIENAIVARAYENPAILEKMMESANNEIRSITGSMADVAADWSRLRNDVKAGDVGGRYDITTDLVKAARRVADARAAGTKPYDILAQMDFADPINAVEAELIRMFYNKDLTRAASRKAVTDALRQYTQLAREARATPGLFGMEDAQPPEGILQQILAERDGKGQGDFLAAAEDRSALYDTDGEARGNEGRDQGPAQEAREGREVGSRREQGDAGSRGQGGRGEVLEDRSGISAPEKGGYENTFMESSFTNRPSVYNGAIRAIGMEPDKFQLLKPERKLELLRRSLTKLTGIEVTVDPRMNLNSAIDQLLDAHQTLQGMANVLGITPRALSLDGKLKLTLVGKARFLGAYYPDKTMIALPGRSNSFAHEWSHALDYFLLDKFGDEGKGLSGAVRRSGADFAPANLREAFVDLMNTMFFDKAAMAQKIMGLEAKIAKSKSDKVKAELQKQIENYRRGASQAKDTRSAFYQSASKMMGADYWTSPTEMMARAMEAYVSYAAELEGYGTEFIGKGDNAYLSNTEQRSALSFPKGPERDAIFEAIGNLMVQLHNEAVLEAHEGNKAEIANDISKITDLDHMVQTVENGNLLQKEMAAWRRQARLRARAIANRARDPKNVWMRVADVWSLAFYSMSGRMKMIQARWKSASIGKAHDLLAFTPGEGRYVGRTFHEAATEWQRKNLNRLTNILKANDLMDMTDAEMRELRDALISEGDSDPTSPTTKAAAAIRRLMDAEFYRNTNAGIDIGYARGVGYLPRILDMPRVLNDTAGFVNRASEVYGLVFDKKYGDSVDDVLERDNGLQNFMRVANGLIKAGVDIPGIDELRALNKQINKLNAAQGKSDDPDAIAAKLEKLVEKQAELLGEMFDAVRDGWSRQAAEAWMNKITTAAEYDFDSHSPDSTYTKSRELPPETDKILEDYYLQNPIEAVQTYLSQSARRVAYAERFGANGEKLKEIMDGMAAEGVPVEDQNEVRKMINIATGRMSQDVGRSARWFLSFVNMYGTMRLLPRAVISSLTEPITAGITAGDFRQGFRALAATMAGTRTMNGKQRAELSRAIGIVLDHGTDTLLAERFGNLYGDQATRFDKITSKMFENTGLVSLTRAQRSQTIAAAHAYLDNLTRRFMEQGAARSADEIALLKELGIRDVAAFAQEFQAKGRLPTVEELDSEWGSDYALAARRFVDLTIQEPDAMVRPQLANNPAGRVLYGITSFSSSFWRNVLKRNAILTKEAFKRGGAAGAAKKAAWGFLPAALTLFGMQAIISTLREYLLNPTRWDEWEREGDGALEKNLAGLAFSRSFAFGVADPFISAYTGLKYQRDLSNVFVGPAVGVFLQDSQNLIAPLQRDSEKTNTTEYNRDRAAYNMLVGPAASIGLSMVPTGPLGGVAAGFGQAAVTSPAAGNAFATALEGPKGMKTDPLTGAPAETMEQYQARMEAKKERARERAAKKVAGE